MTDLKYENGLKEIRQQRGTVNSLDSPMLVLIGPMILTAVFAPPIAVFLCFVILYVYYSRLKRAAHHPCPKCAQPFGTSSRIVLGVGADSCQNCGLSLWGN